MDPGIRLLLITLSMLFSDWLPATELTAAAPEISRPGFDLVNKSIEPVEQLQNQVLIRELLAQVTPVRQQRLHIEISGTVTSPSLPVATRVKQGDVLLVLDNRQALALQRQAQADVVRKQAQLRFQRTQLHRVEKNLSRGAVAAVERDKVQSQIDQLAAELVRAVAQLEIATLHEEQHRLLAPFAGVLLARTPYPGDRIDPNSSAVTLLDDSALVATIELPPQEVLALQQGRLAVAMESVGTGSSVVQPLVLESWAPAASTDSGMVDVELVLPAESGLLPGQSLYLGLYSIEPFNSPVAGR